MDSIQPQAFAHLNIPTPPEDHRNNHNSRPAPSAPSTETTSSAHANNAYSDWVVAPAARLATNIAANIAEAAAPICATAASAATDTLQARYGSPAQITTTLNRVKGHIGQLSEQLDQMDQRYHDSAEVMAKQMEQIDRHNTLLTVSMAHLEHSKTALKERIKHQGCTTGLIIGAAWVFGEIAKNTLSEDHGGETRSIINQGVYTATATAVVHALYTLWHCDEMRAVTQSFTQITGQLLSLGQNGFGAVHHLLSSSSDILRDIGELSHDMRATVEVSHQILEGIIPNDS